MFQNMRHEDDVEAWGNSTISQKILQWLCIKQVDMPASFLRSRRKLDRLILRCL